MQDRVLPLPRQKKMLCYAMLFNDINDTNTQRQVLWDVASKTSHLRSLTCADAQLPKVRHVFQR